ncbi:hypothetical protein GYA19_05290 [Candidatus Beckwithbacteria bacterium]|nr:hypothetical protein [Candidatus Beckwithbacteria bacterium]
MNKINSVQIFSGADGIKKAYRQSLQTQKLDIVCTSENYSQIIGSYFDEEYSPQLLNSNIKTKEILPDSPDNRAYASKKNQTKNQTGFVSVNKSIETDLLIGDNFVIQISYHKAEPLALLITDPELVKSAKFQFELMWRQADK